MFSHFFRKLASVVRASPHQEKCETVAAGGLLWHVTPAGRELFGPAGPDLAGWETDARLEPVKRNRQRTISRVQLPNGSVYLKHCRANTPRAWIRELLRPAKARLEFENALTLRDRGVPGVEPLGWGAASSALPGDSYLLTRGQDGAEPLNVFLNFTLPALPSAIRPAACRQVARGFAAYLAKLHDAGVVHPDPHTGNFLVETSPDRPPRFFLIDLHDVEFGRPLPWAGTRANLALLNRWFLLHASRTDRLRAWRAYVGARSTLGGDAKAMAKEIEAATAASLRRFWNARIGRYRGTNRDCRRVAGAAASGHAFRSVPDEWLRSWLADPDAVFDHPGARLMKDAPESTVAAVPVGDTTLVFKRFLLPSAKAVAKNAVRPSPAMRSWVVGNNLMERDLPTARVLAVFHRRRGGVPLTGYVVFEKVPDAVGLTEAVAALEKLPEARRRAVLRSWTDKLGRVARRMHERDVSNRDFKAPNILMAGAAVDPLTAEPVLIDLVGVRVGSPVPEATRVRDLARLNASFVRSAVVSRTDRLRFLRSYLLDSLRPPADWKVWWRRVARATEAKVAKNERSGRPLW